MVVHKTQLMHIWGMRNCLFALAAAASMLSSPSVAGEVKPIFTYDDYPPEALRKHEQGTAVVELTIDDQGRPKACRIVKSSGYKLLDDQTCDLIMSRAKFNPARDKDGKPRWDTFKAPPITWQIH